MPEALTRRDRLRAETLREITATARRILVEQGAAAVTLRAIARAMGMTAPALYRYYDSHDELIRHLCADILTELCDGLDATVATTSRHSGDDPAGKLVAASWEFRRWSLEHPGEFALIFGSRLPQHAAAQRDVAEECARRFGGIFAMLFAQLWAYSPFPVPDPASMSPGLRAELEQFRATLEVPLPVGAAQVFLQCWSRLYGMVTLEVFGHLNFALTDTQPMFELMLNDIATQLGGTYP